MSDEVNYEKLLADVETEIAKLQSVAAFARMKLGLEVPTGLSGQPQQTVIGSKNIPSDAFFGMSVSDAIKKYLGFMKHTCRAQEITDGLKAGGLPHQTENLYGSVYVALRRGQKTKVFSPVGKKWGLTEWYKT